MISIKCILRNQINYLKIEIVTKGLKVVKSLSSKLVNCNQI